MFVNWLRESKVSAAILVFLRVYVGWYFLKAGWGKVTGEGFDASGYLKNAIANPVGGEAATYPWMVSFLEKFALPNIDLFNFLVPWGEVLVGIGMIVGGLTTAATFFAMFMSFTFMFAGTVSSNPLLILMNIFIIVAGANAGRYGIDRWILPYFRQLFGKNKKEVVGSSTY